MISTATDATTAKAVGFFEGRLYSLSNFSAHRVEYMGETFATSEHAYQTLKFADPAMRAKIKNAPSAFLAREFGQAEQGRTPNFDKVNVIKDIMRAKIRQHEDVRRALESTGDAIILKDHPDDDGFWGTGPDGKGQNVMGKIWMELRGEMRSAA